MSSVYEFSRPGKNGGFVASNHGFDPGKGKIILPEQKVKGRYVVESLEDKGSFLLAKNPVKVKIVKSIRRWNAEDFFSFSNQLGSQQFRWIWTMFYEFFGGTSEGYNIYEKE